MVVSPRDISGTSCTAQDTAPAELLPPPGIPAYAPAAMAGSQPPAGLSANASQIAEVIGILPLVRDIRALETAEPPVSAEARQQLLELRQDFSEWMMTTFYEVNSIAGQIDCEAIRASHVAETMFEFQEQRAQRYEINAIVGDALVGIAGGALTLGLSETAAAIADIFGGNLMVGFGLASAFTEEEHQYRNPRNFLREIREAPQKSGVFPEAVWRFLNWPPVGEGEHPTIRQELIAEWQADGFIAESGAEDRRERLVFGTGGVYEIEDLRAQAQMLQELKTTINRMVQQLHLLSREVFDRHRPGLLQNASS